MKNTIYIIAFSFVSLGYCQSIDKNYVKTLIYKQPVTTSTNSPNNIPDVLEANTTIFYYDGLGRPIQRLDYKQSDTKKNVITPIEYDEFGIQIKNYLPYVSNEQDASYAETALDDVFTFYDSANPNVTGNSHFEQTANYYSEIKLDNSPMNRVLMRSSPGDDWQMNGGHENKYEYSLNIENEVKKFVVDLEYQTSCKYYDPSLSLLQGLYYDKGELFKTVTKNENWTNGNNNTTVVYKNSEGKTILKVAYNDVPHYTHYIYDTFGNLTYIIPPIVNTSNTITQEILDGSCYQYAYDYRNRLVKKKLPGKQWEYIIYDKLNRPIITGPVFSPFGDVQIGFIYTKYDVFNRICYSGWFASDVDETRYCHLQNQYYNSVNNAIKNQTSTTLDNIQINYTTDNLPGELKLLSINYYDNYDFSGAPAIPQEVLGQNVCNNVKGLHTGNWSRVLTNDTEYSGETTTLFYDLKSRPILIRKKNYLNGFSQNSIQYNFIGQPTNTITEHKRLASSPDLVIKEKHEYNHNGKLVYLIHQLNQNEYELISHSKYDELGNLITKNVGGPDTNTFVGLQKIDYQYNVKGWLTKINDTENLTESGSPTDLFAFKINYNNLQNTLGDQIEPLFNGNIAETYWRTSSDNVLRKYSYRYDSLNRLNQAIYQKPNFAVQVTDSYNEDIGYDKNGNITSLNRNGELDNQEEILPIDALEYTYSLDKPNQLIKVTDGTNNPNGFFDDTNTDIGDINADYSYDDNGNLKYDHNKSIENILYNHLNLPTKIIFTNGNYIEYLYNANGKKLKKTVSSGGQITKTDYLDGFQYKNNKLQFFPTAEGYVSCYEDESTSGRIFSYVYTYKDLWGNIRLTYSKDPATGNVKILEENHYYPFGLKHTNYNSDKKEYGKQNSVYLLKEIPSSQQSIYNYKFQEQELQDELGLNWYSFKWRNYDPAVGRFMCIDPLAEKYTYNSPYAFQENKMGMGRELEGLELVSFNTYAAAFFGTLSPNAQQAIDGVGLIIGGTLGVIGAAGYIGETAGVGVALGGGAAISLSVAEVSLGITKMNNAFTNSNNYAVSKASSLPGYAAYSKNVPHAKAIDGIGGFIPGMFSGGNFKNLVDATRDLWKGTKTFGSILELWDGAEDIESGWEALDDLKNDDGIEIDDPNDFFQDRPSLEAIDIDGADVVHFGMPEIIPGDFSIISTTDLSEQNYDIPDFSPFNDGQ